MAPAAAQRGIQFAVTRLAFLHAAPETRRVIHVTGVREFMAEQIAHHFQRLEQQRQVQRDQPARRTAAPACALAADAHERKTEAMLPRQLHQHGFKRPLGAPCQPALQRALLLRARAAATHFEHAARFTHAQGSGAASLEHSPAFAQQLQSDFGRRERDGRWRARTAPFHMVAHPFQPALEKSAGMALGHAARHHQLDRATGAHTHRHATGALAVAQPRNGLIRLLSP